MSFLVKLNVRLEERKKVKALRQLMGGFLSAMFRG
jgi:hypothetical protein